MDMEDVIEKTVINFISITLGLGILYLLNGQSFNVTSLIVFLYLSHIISDIRGRG